MIQPISFFVTNAWRWTCGLPEIEIPVYYPSLEELKMTEWSLEFEKLMRNRLIMGALRYGKMKSSDKPVYDRISSIKKRINNYENKGNLEDLVDIANLALCEFVEGKHPLKHFKSSDDGEHCKHI